MTNQDNSMPQHQPKVAESGLTFTGRCAGWSARHRWKVVIATITILLIAVFLSNSFGVNTSDVFGAGEAQKAQELWEDRFDTIEPADELILFHNPNIDADNPDFHTVVDPLVSKLRTYEGVNSVYSYYDTEISSMKSEDGHVLLARLEFEPAEKADLEKWVEPVMDAVEDYNNNDLDNTGFEVSMLGGTSADVSFGNLIDDEFSMILTVALVAGFIVLLLTFGSPLAALIPLGLALAAIFAAIGLAVPVSRIQPLNFYYYEMIMLIGLAVGVDYSLFIINRFREEREALKPKLDAIIRASDTTGRAVFYAGLTVVASVAGLLITGDSLFLGLGIGAMIVVFFAIIASLTLLPAFLSIIGDKVNMWRIKGLGRPSHGGGVWGFITDRVLARPAIFASVTLAILIAAAIPVFSLHIGSTPITSETVPEKLEGYRALQLLEDNFGGTSELVSLYVVVDPGKKGTVDTPEIQASVDDLVGRLEQDDTFVPPFDVQENDEHNLLVVTAPRLGSDDESQGKAAVKRLRDELIPAAFSNSNGVDVLVTGGAAYTLDAANNVKSKAPYVFAFVLGLAFLLLMMMFRSIIIPVKAIILNMISVGAAYGILVLVFQEGVVGEGLLDFKAVGIIEIFMPLFLFAVLFGLSMDYHMLVLSRIKEAYDGGHSNEASVSSGIKATAALITSAAAIMILVFGAFALSSAMFMKQMGFGLGIAVLIDATLIRAVLLPASMKLLGDWNWYLPGWLEWLPRISPEVGATSRKG